MPTTAGWVQDLRATWMPVVNAERKDRARSAILDDDDDRTRDRTRNVSNAVCWPIGIMNRLCHLTGKKCAQKAMPLDYDWFWSTNWVVRGTTSEFEIWNLKFEILIWNCNYNYNKFFPILPKLHLKYSTVQKNNIRNCNKMDWFTTLKINKFKPIGSR